MCLCFFYSFFLVVYFYSHSLVIKKNAGCDFDFLKYAGLILWPSIWSILENISCSLEKNVYSSIFGWNAL